MFGRPRCREWTPLATQQLRLRSLIQIVGYNIRPPENCTSYYSFYLTLHHTTMSAPFYTSERISSPHPKWKEIDSEITENMSSTNVVIRIWCHVLQSNEGSSNKTEKSQDTIILTYGVYFSGLRYIGANLASNFTAECFKSNTLVFQMHGGYFCSYKSLKLDVIPPENEVEPGSISSESSGKTNISKKITIEPKFLQNRKQPSSSRSISPSQNKRFDKEVSKSQSPVDRNFKQPFPSLRTSASLNIQKVKDEKLEIFEHSPDFVSEMNDNNCDNHKSSTNSSKIDLSETAENYDLRSEADWVPKYRYMALSFLKSEIRPSYNASKLQKLHIFQYSIKKKKDAVMEIKERIHQKSALEDFGLLKDEIKLVPKTSSRNLFDLAEEVAPKSTNMGNEAVNNPRKTLKLNDLLSFKSKPSPFQRAEHVRLTKQLEILRFKRIILADERDAKLANIRRLKEVYAKLCEENQDTGSALMESYHRLSKQLESLKENNQSCFAMRELAARTHSALIVKRTEMLNQLADIFHIEEKDPTTWTINGIPLQISGMESLHTHNVVMGSTAAVNTVSKAICTSSRILACPLRHDINLVALPTILDHSLVLPDPNIPLYVRSGDTTLYKYGMFLLNKNIAQLLYNRGILVTDIRPTLANLKRLMTAPANTSDTAKLFGTNRFAYDQDCLRTQSLRCLVASDRGKCGRQFNRFKDAVDGQSPKAVMSLKRHRLSKSVGSYQDDQELSIMDASTTSLIGSEPIMYDDKSSHKPKNTTETIKTHNSDSEISKITENKVVFTLGDDTKLENLTEKLVKISTNNDDQYDDFKRICTEITDYCEEKLIEQIQDSCDNNFVNLDENDSETNKLDCCNEATEKKCDKLDADKSNPDHDIILEANGSESNKKNSFNDKPTSTKTDTNKNDDISFTNNVKNERDVNVLDLQVSDENCDLDKKTVTYCDDFDVKDDKEESSDSKNVKNNINEKDDVINTEGSSISNYNYSDSANIESQSS